MTTITERLANAPPPQVFESVSCWLSRLAVSQGTNLDEVLNYLRIPSDIDVDRQMHGSRLHEIRKICGLPDSALHVHDRVMCSLEKISPIDDNFLLTSPKGQPRFRYCPECLRTMRIPHFPVHWRFGAWRWCPEHDCLLDELCPECDSPILFPKNIWTSRAGRNGYFMLNRCLKCSTSLSQREPCYLKIGNLRRVSLFEDTVLSNGRGLLAALYYGGLKSNANDVHQDLTRLAHIKAMGVLPSKIDWLPPAHVRERIQPLRGKSASRWIYGGMEE